MTNFTDKQKEIVARKLGYDGPMQGFDAFINSSPALQAKYSTITDKYVERMAKGGSVVKKYAPGGLASVGANYRGSLDASTKAYQDAQTAAAKAEADAIKQATTPTNVPAAPTVTPVTISDAEAQKLTTQTTVEQAPTVQATAQQQTAAGVTAPTTVTSQDITADTVAKDVKRELDKQAAAQGQVSDQAQVEAATVDPTKTAVGDLTAAQGQAAQVTGVTPMEVQQDELVSGSAVDQAKVEQAMQENIAAQGQVTEEMTVQGQLNKLTTDFDAGNPPAWAASTMRTATAALAARGLGASSMAGQAIIQATLEAAVPIAAADAKTFTEMGLQNLSNRQQMAILSAEQRAKFLGQEFDQNFQSKVLNAARVADVANKNFDANVQIQLENARLVNSMNLQNLQGEQALVLEEAAQIARLETQNLDNIQKTRVQNANAFLQMDLQNVENEQQMAVIKAQKIADAMMQDSAQINSAKATNAKNKLEADSTNASLALAASQYNAIEQNKVKIANLDAATQISKYNAQEENMRNKFNAEQANAIAVANAKILADISTTNTKEINAANVVNAKNATDLSARVYSEQMQTYRDSLEYSFTAGENDADRKVELAKASLQSYTSLTTAKVSADAKSSASIGNFLGELTIEYAKSQWD